MECARQFPVLGLNLIDHHTLASPSHTNERSTTRYQSKSSSLQPSFASCGRKRLKKLDNAWKRSRNRESRRDGTEGKSRNAAAAVAPVALYFRSQLGNAASISCAARAPQTKARQKKEGVLE